MSQTPHGTWTFFAAMGRGKTSLPPDADADDVTARLRRYLHTIECRELGADAAQQRFGQFADTHPGHVFLGADPDHLLAQYPDHAELHDLLDAVRDRGPAVAVTLTTTRA
ncbi:hypothetical protein [Streptomyces sp. NBC_00280]|uniref:hypothetical protein n=1 Tax=Streptomyces sp. NBC_00280 TaxID=2975699 RepID=UPI002F90E5D8